MNGERFLSAAHVVHFLNVGVVARCSWEKLKSEHKCLQPVKDLQDAGTADDWAFNYTTKSGMVTVVLRIPGIQFVAENMPSQSENYKKLHALITDWEKRQNSGAPNAGLAGRVEKRKRIAKPSAKEVELFARLGAKEAEMVARLNAKEEEMFARLSAKQNDLFELVHRVFAV